MKLHYCGLSHSWTVKINLRKKCGKLQWIAQGTYEVILRSAVRKSVKKELCHEIENVVSPGDSQRCCQESIRLWSGHLKAWSTSITLRSDSNEGIRADTFSYSAYMSRPFQQEREYCKTASFHSKGTGRNGLVHEGLNDNETNSYLQWNAELCI